MFGNNIVKNSRIHQEIKWNVPVLRYNAKPQFFVRYAKDSIRLFSDSKVNYSSDQNTTLQLTFGTSNITYYVAVAVRHTAEQGRGDYSDIISIAYTSEYILYEDSHITKPQSLLIARSQNMYNKYCVTYLH